MIGLASVSIGSAEKLGGVARYIGRCLSKSAEVGPGPMRNPSFEINRDRPTSPSFAVAGQTWPSLSMLGQIGRPWARISRLAAWQANRLGSTCEFNCHGRSLLESWKDEHAVCASHVNYLHDGSRSARVHIAGPTLPVLAFSCRLVPAAGVSADVPHVDLP